MTGALMTVGGYVALIASCGWWGLGVAALHVVALVGLTKWR